MNEIDKMLEKATKQINEIELGDWENLVRLRYWLGYCNALLELKEKGYKK